MYSHARRRPLTCKAVEKQKRVPNAIKNSSRLVTGAAASQIIHFLLAGLALADFKVLLKSPLVGSFYETESEIWTSLGWFWLGLGQLANLEIVNFWYFLKLF